MLPQVPDYIRSLNPYVPGKPIEETQREFKLKKVIKLASNENPLGSSPRAMQAIKKGLSELHRYPDAAAYQLKKALAVANDVSAAQIVVGNGSNELIDFVIRTFCITGDFIVTSQAAFIAYKLCAQIHGVGTIEAPLTEDLRFDLDAILQRVRSERRARVVFIANPNNPTGTYVSDKELRGFLTELRALRGESVLVVLDDAYREYVRARDLPDACALMEEFPNVVVLRTFSKIYGLAGLRVGYSLASPEITASLEKVRQPFNVNSLALAAAEAALTDRAFVARSRKNNEQGMKLWESALKKSCIPYWPSQGNFLLIDTVKGLGKPGGEIYLSCLQKGVILRPVANYGLLNALRISIGTPDENRFAIKVLGQVSGRAR